MMAIIRHPLRLLLLVLCGLLASCIEGREEYWIESNGSGMAEIHYDVPAAIAAGLGGEAGISKLLDQFIKDTPTLTHAVCQVRRKGDRMAVDFKASFKSVLDLITAVSGNSVLSAGDAKALVNPLIGQFDIRQRGRGVELTRTVKPSGALPGSLFMPDSQFTGRRLQYILHLPVRVLESNATRTEDGGRTLIWDHSLKDGLKKNIVIHFKAAMPLPWWIMAVAAVTLVLSGWLGFRWWRRRNRLPVPPHA